MILQIKPVFVPKDKIKEEKGQSENGCSFLNTENKFMETLQ